MRVSGSFRIRQDFFSNVFFDVWFSGLEGRSRPACLFLRPLDRIVVVLRANRLASFKNANAFASPRNVLSATSCVGKVRQHRTAGFHCFAPMRMRVHVSCAIAMIGNINFDIRTLDGRRVWVFWEGSEISLLGGGSGPAITSPGGVCDRDFFWSFRFHVALFCAHCCTPAGPRRWTEFMVYSDKFLVIRKVALPPCHHEGAAMAVQF